MKQTTTRETPIRPGGQPSMAPLARPLSSLDLNYEADLRVALKTRRAVRDEVLSAQDRRLRQRRSMGFALLGFVSMLVLFAPALWNGLEYLLAEEHLLEWPTQVAFLMLMFFLAMLAALIAAWKGQWSVQRDRRGFETFNPLEK